MTAISPDEVSNLCEAVRARLAAVRGILPGLPEVRDTPASPAQIAKAPSVEVYPGDEDEDFGNNGSPMSPRTAGTVIVGLKVMVFQDWRPRLAALRQAVRGALLQDPAFMRIHGPVTGLSTKTEYVEAGEAGVIAACAMRFTFEYQTDYPPVVDDDLGAINLKINTLDPRDPNRVQPNGLDDRVEAEVSVTLPNE